MSDLADQFAPTDTLDLVELQLQQELRAMFDVDSQRYLQDYLTLTQQLNAASWTPDMQEIYRVVHTIKGGAVTVGADACLKVATVLEDLLSDLRHLTPAPPLEDRHLINLLLEAGELLAGSLQVQGIGEAITILMQPSVQRIRTLHEHVKDTYLSGWSEQYLLHQEFADQGFGLVVLQLEMAVDKLFVTDPVSTDVMDIATQTLAQLAEIGQDLEFAEGWTTLLEGCERLVQESSAPLWKLQWPGYLTALQTSARQGGPFIEPIFAEPSAIAPSPDSTHSEILALADLDLDFSILDVDHGDPPPVHLIEPNGPALDGWEESSLSLEDLATFDFDPESFELHPLPFGSDHPEETDTIPSNPITAEIPDVTATVLDDSQELSDLAELFDLADLPIFEDRIQPLPEPLSVEPETQNLNDWLGLVSPDPRQAQQEPVDLTKASRDRLTEASVSDVQIPVPLGRLDQTAQTLVETLLSLRASQGLYQNLQSQLTQLLTLAQDSAQYIADLRKLQDNYALLDQLKTSRQLTDGLTLERYRQGYSTINRLLETSLRLSELGAEAHKSAQSTASSLQALDRNVLILRHNVEQSRLVPFKNLGFRARAILRDLITRLGKPAQLVIEGEDIELDAATAYQLEPALLHLIRNAYDHGLEHAADRISSGKLAQGTLMLSLRRSSSRYRLELKDDGHGIDAERVRKAAEAKGLPLTRTDTDKQLLAVICQPGFSSQASVNDISGRGVGMDVVAHQIERLGGRLQLETQVGKGTTFQLQFPVPQLLLACVLLQVGDRTVAIPAQDIAATLLWDSLSATSVTDRSCPYTWQITQGETVCPGLDLLDYWQPQATVRSLPDTAIALYIRAPESEQNLVVVADDLLGQTELLINPLPEPLSPPMGLLGVSLQNDGSLISVIDAATLAEQLTQPTPAITQLTAAMGIAAPQQPQAPTPVVPSEDAAESNRTILVVDDAALMRRRIEASLTAYGYTVAACVDGQEAWNWLQSHTTPAMVITDIEMPNMDGFTLIDRARQSGLTIPMMVISSRLAEEWSKEAKRLGATDYLTKGFSTQDLISKVKALL